MTDSTADLTEDVRGSLGIAVVPLSLTIGGESFEDGTLSQAELFARMDAAHVLPSTSQPSVGAFADTYRSALQTATEVVSVHISSRLSGTCSTARRTAEEFFGKVHVIDSMNLSWGMGLQVVEAARVAASGAGAAGVVAAVERARDRVQMIVGLDSLDQLVKGGRIGRVAGAVGGILNVKVTITPRDGELVVVRSIRGARQALEFTMRWVEERLGGAKRGAFTVMHALAEDRAEWLRDAIRERFAPTELRVVETGAAIATHTGTGWAVAFLPED